MCPQQQTHILSKELPAMRKRKYPQSEELVTFLPLGRDDPGHRCCPKAHCLGESWDRLH